MRVFNNIDELREAVGTHLGHSSWITVDQERVNQFANATSDHQWIHVDVERAASGPFGGTIAHGFLTLSLIPAMAWDIFRIDGLAMEINYGLNKVRFPAVVPAGSSIRGGVELVAVEPFGNGFQSITRMTIEHEGGDKPVCVAEVLGYLVPA